MLDCFALVFRSMYCCTLSLFYLLLYLDLYVIGNDTPVNK